MATLNELFQRGIRKAKLPEWKERHVDLNKAPNKPPIHTDGQPISFRDSWESWISPQDIFGDRWIEIQ